MTDGSSTDAIGSGVAILAEMSGYADGLWPQTTPMPLQIGFDPVVFLVLVVVGFLVVGIAGPLLLLQMREARPPSSDEAAILEDLLVHVESSFAEIRVVDTVGERSISTTIRGLPGRRYLIVTDYVIRELEADVARALLAAEDARARTFYVEYRVVAAAAILGLATAMFSGLIDFGTGLFLMAIGALVLFWLGRQLQYRADAIAAERVGEEALAAAFERIAAVKGIELDSGSWRTWVEIQPPLGSRVDRLRDR